MQLLSTILKIVRHKTTIWVLSGGVVLLLVWLFIILPQTGLAPHAPKDTQRAVTHKKPTPPSPPELPLGGRVIFPSYRMVALYGSPDAPVLGALGQQPIKDSITRIKTLAATYQQYSKQQIMPTFEIIATIASQSPTLNNNYSLEQSVPFLEPWVKAAQEADIYVILDLQPGRSDFLTEAKMYTQLLKYPNVGLALDPEWRLKPHEFPLVQIGSVTASEVNQTAGWLAELVDQNNLPQKLFVLHQFRLDMIANRSQLDTTHTQLAYVIQMDGQGTQPQKRSTWDTVRQSAPPNVRFGWKNFYNKDDPVLSPKATMQLTPQPWYVSYQ